MFSPVPPAYTIAKANYPNFNKDPIPGPADYDPCHVTRSSLPAYSFGRSPRKLHADSEFPGPGLYSPRGTQRSPGFTISKSPRVLSNVRYISPGPGDYSYQQLQAKYQYSISKARRRMHGSPESPGPGYYSPNQWASLEKSPRMKFQSQARMPRQSFLTPAPGQYDLPSVDRTPGYTMPKAQPKRSNSNSPGPGSYEVPYSFIGAASVKKQ